MSKKPLNCQVIDGHLYMKVLDMANWIESNKIDDAKNKPLYENTANGLRSMHERLLVQLQTGKQVPKEGH